MRGQASLINLERNILGRGNSKGKSQEMEASLSRARVVEGVLGGNGIGGWGQST